MELSGGEACHKPPWNVTPCIRIGCEYGNIPARIHQSQGPAIIAGTRAPSGYRAARKRDPARAIAPAMTGPTLSAAATR